MRSFEKTEKEEIFSGFYIVCKLHLYVSYWEKNIAEKTAKEIIPICIE